MARSLVRVTVPITLATTDLRQSGFPYTALDQKGAGAAHFMLIGYVPGNTGTPANQPYNGIYRSYLKPDIDAAIAAAFDNGYADVGTLRQAYLSLTTRYVTDTGSYPRSQSYFQTGSDARVQMKRLTSNPAFGSAGDGLVENVVPPTHWKAADWAGITSGDWIGAAYEESVSPNDEGETRVRCTPLVAGWMKSVAGGGSGEPPSHPIRFWDPNSGRTDAQAGDPAHVSDTHAGYAQHGVVLKVPAETAATGYYRSEFYSPRSSVAARYKPHFVLVIEPYVSVPLTPRLIAPKGIVNADTPFSGIIDEDENDPVVGVRIRVGPAGGTTWTFGPTEYTRSPRWPEGRFVIPRDPSLATGDSLSWEARAVTAGGKLSPWSESQPYSYARELPTVTPQPVGDTLVLTGTRLRASFTIP